MSADFLQDLVCSCKGKSPCKKSCACFEEKLACTDLCFCQGSDWCKHAQTHTLRRHKSGNWTINVSWNILKLILCLFN
jgi:hypothetical protein